MADKARHAQKSHKGLVAAIIIIILLAGAGVAGYYYRDEVVKTYNSVVDKIMGQDTAETTATAAATEQGNVEVTEPATVAVDPTTQKAREIVARMGENEKICQLFVVTPEQLTGVSPVTVAGPTTKTQLKKYPVGGIVYFEQNKADDKSFKTMVKKTKTFSKTPLFIMENGEEELFTYEEQIKTSEKLTKDSTGDKALQAFKEGARVLLMPKNLEKTVKRFADAVESGELDSLAVNSAVTDIIKLKISNGIIE